MAETTTNRGKYRMLAALAADADLRMLAITGTAAGVNDPDLNTVADLDAVTGVSIHTERITLTGILVTENDTDDRGELDADNAVFAAAAGVTAVGVAIFDHTGGADASRDLISIHTTGFPKVMDGGLTVDVADLLRAS
jgi:hypothetical protein